MNKAYTEIDEFVAARKQFERMVSGLQSKDMSVAQHGELEAWIGKEGNELLRSMFQGHLDLRANQEPMLESITGSDNAERKRRREGCERDLMTLFGAVKVRRIGYSAKESSSLFPMDKALNLPPEKYSHGLRQRAAEEVLAKSFDQSVASIASSTGGKVPKLQMEKLAARMAQDFESFYDSGRATELQQTDNILVMSIDQKGIVMQQDSLRECTKKAAKNERHKMKTRLSRGEKRNRKRMATVATTYSIARNIRSPELIMGIAKDEISAPKPRPQNKRVWASVARQPEDITEEMFQEALRQDPQKRRPWVALVDGGPQQLKNLWSAIFRHGVEGTTVILDFIHVLEYLWKAAFAFAPEGSEAAESWVKTRALSILKGRASYVAAGMRRAASLLELSAEKREPVDKCADYLLKYKDMMRYPSYLAKGYPIATGVIEGACRHLIKDRMDITGARWGLESAEAILKLRSLKSSGDLQEYWKYHNSQELQRHHLSRYHQTTLTVAA